MPGIYIHIPFCKQACSYCDFHFSTSLKYKNEMLAALFHELAIRKSYLPNEPIDTIYFGGGTPSLLSGREIATLIDRCASLYNISPAVEITLECNPDDLSQRHLKDIKSAGINRLSIGIQSFFEEDLQLMNRAHNATEAIQCLENAKSQGFDNITIDLIYGSSTLSHDGWIANLEQFIHFDIPHLSAYALTVEPNTALAYQVKKEPNLQPKDSHQAEQFTMLMDFALDNNFDHYEISNLCKPGFESRHNTAYWQSKPYLGIGPSAHSFDGTNRGANLAHNRQYIDAINQQKSPYCVEVLTTEEQFNDYVMSRLRTKWGIDMDYIATNWGHDHCSTLQPSIKKWQSQNFLAQQKNALILTRNGKLIADTIISDLFWVT